MFRMWLSAVLVLTLCPPAVAQSQAASCIFAGARLPCTVESDVAGAPTITLKPLTRDEWEFLERDMAPEATALHAALLNHTTWDNAQRYALSQIYRQYRAVQAMKLATYAREQIMSRVRAKYGDLDEFSLLEAVVIEAGLPVIHVPDLPSTGRQKSLYGSSTARQTKSKPTTVHQFAVRSTRTSGKEMPGAK